MVNITHLCVSPLIKCRCQLLVLLLWLSANTPCQNILPWHYCLSKIHLYYLLKTILWPTIINQWFVSYCGGVKWCCYKVSPPIGWIVVPYAGNTKIIDIKGILNYKTCGIDILLSLKNQIFHSISYMDISPEPLIVNCCPIEKVWYDWKIHLCECGMLQSSLLISPEAYILPQYFWILCI